MPNLRSTYDLSNILRKTQRQFLRTIYMQNRKIVSDSVRELTYDIPKRNFSTLYYRKWILR